MFNACKRGQTSLLRVLYAAKGSFRTSARPPSLPLSIQSFPSPILFTKWIHLSRRLRNRNNSEHNGQSRESHNVTRFQELQDFDMVHPNVVKQVTQKMKLDTLTEVQVATINEALQGVDIIAQARTGTGKTLGFLIPTIQNILRHSPELASRQRYSRARPSDIRAIIISPTRELAEQIAVEAEKLCYNTDLVVQVAVGGNSKRQMLMKTQREGCHLLVATPGRLTDLLTDEYSGVEAPNLTTLVLDEADRLLDEGFSKDIEKLVKILPDRNVKDRQTLLFSATVPKEVMHLVKKTLKPNFHFVQTVKEGDLATHEKVPQNIIITPGIENWMPTLVQIAKNSIDAASSSQNTSDEEKKRPFKAIVYFSSTAQVQLAYEIIIGLRSGESPSRYGNHLLKPAELYIINGSMTQEGRTRAANRFRASSCGMLFSTDVTARGMDFPGVTHVIQFGLPPNKEQYIHRVGRTGRGDKTGESYLVIDSANVSEAKRILRGLPITEDKSFTAANHDMEGDAEIPSDISYIFDQVTASTSKSSRRSKEAAYKSALNNVRSASQAVSLARWTKIGWGFEKPPPISSLLAGRLGLKRLPGINIGPPTEFDDEPARSPGYGSSFGDRGRNGNFSSQRDRSSFGDRRERDSFGGRGGRGGFGSRGDRSSFGDRGSRGSFGDRGNRGSFGDRGNRGSFGDRGDRGSFGDRGDRGSFGDRGDRGSFGNRGERGGFGGRGGRGGFGSRGDRSSFGDRGDRGSFGDRGEKGGFGGRGGRGSFGSRGGRGSFDRGRDNSSRKYMR